MNYDFSNLFNKTFNHSDIETTLRYIGAIKDTESDDTVSPLNDYTSETFLKYIGAPGYVDLDAIHAPFETDDPNQFLKDFFNHKDEETTLRYIGAF